jgi:hypothetical protein
MREGIRPLSVHENCRVGLEIKWYSEIIAVCSEIHTKHINTVRTAQ